MSGLERRPEASPLSATGKQAVATRTRRLKVAHMADVKENRSNRW